MTETLKPCPFCGSKPEAIERNIPVGYGKSGKYIEIACVNHACHIAPSTWAYSTRDTPERAWNTRAVEE